MEIPNIINMKSKISTSTNINEFYKKLSPFNITGINDYNHKNDNNNKYKLCPSHSKFNFKKILPILTNETFEQNEKEEKLSFIKSLIKKPKNQPYDGYACFRKKPTINYLLKKFELKDNQVILEKNKLCKIPYPLIKFISNRKSPNKSKELMTDILGAELNDLSASQKNDIKYKKYKLPIKITKLKCPEIFNNNSNFFRKIKNFSDSKKNDNKKDLEIPLIYKYIDKKNIKNKDMVKTSFNRNRNLYSGLETCRPCYNNRRIKNILMKSYCGEDNNLTEHSTFTNNISIMKNGVSKKLESKNEKFDDILKDISQLKSNNHIMAFES